MRPRPPFDTDEPVLRFEPDANLAEWVRATFIDEEGPLHNPDHAHLDQANIGFVWTNESNSRAGRTVLGQCEIMPPMAMGKWARARAIHQIETWFGEMPDFLITIFAPATEIMDDPSFMALIEHELYHAAQATDEFGMPKFNKQTGRPIFSIRGHDVEEFVGVVRRYGADAAGVRAMIEAANDAPEIGRATIAQVCGNCLRLVG
jgi:hypothetical protein